MKEAISVLPNLEITRPNRTVVAGASVHESDEGRTTIHAQVVAKIAGLAVKEVSGVTRLVPFGASQQVASFAKAMTKSAMNDLGVHVEVGEAQVSVDVRIVTEFGASIPSISEAIRRNVSDRIETMTGLKVVDVNIDVVDLSFVDDLDNVDLQESIRESRSRVQ